MPRPTDTRPLPPRPLAPWEQSPPEEGQLDYLMGARFLGAIWIVCAHYLPKGPLVLLRGRPAHVKGGFLNGVALRDNVAVDFFVVLSGFMTHWAYRESVEPMDLAGIRRYYIKRLGRTLLTTWLAMLCGWLAQVMLALQGSGDSPDTWHVVRCFCFVEQWRPLPENWCPSGPSWFVFALLPGWLLYPCLSAIVGTLEKHAGTAALAGAALLLYCISFGPTLVLFLLQGHNVTFAQRAAGMYYPHVQLPDFALGVVAAAAARRHQRWASAEGCWEQSGDLDLDLDVDAGLSLPLRERVSCCGSSEEKSAQEREVQRCAHLADACAALTVLATCAWPTACPPHGLCEGDHQGWEPFLDHGLSPALAGFLFAAGVAGSQSGVASALSHGALVELGKLSFEVYIFQEPLHQFFQLLTDTRAPEAFMAYLLCLFAFAALYARYVQLPLNRALQQRGKKASTTWWPESNNRVLASPISSRCSSRSDYARSSRLDSEME